MNNDGAFHSTIGLLTVGSFLIFDVSCYFCLPFFTALFQFSILSAGWVVTYGTDEEALERKIREKYGTEIRQVEGKKQAMSDIYMAALNPGSNVEQERRFDQVLRGGRGEVKRNHDSVDKKYYGTEEGKENQLKAAERMATHQEEERERAKRIKKRLKKLRKQQQQAEGGETSDSESESETTTYSSDKKKAAAATVAALALASAGATSESKAEKAGDTNPFKKVNAKLKALKNKNKKKEKKQEVGGIHLSQVATLTAVAGTAALVGFLVGGGSRR